jgi:alpha-beta hydrolase superfamily lysophospholipase
MRRLVSLVQGVRAWSGEGLHVVCVQNPLTSFAEDVAAAKRLIDAQDGSVLLAGHSHGGAVSTEAGNNPKVAGDGFLLLTPKRVVEDFASDLMTEHREYFTGVDSEKPGPPGVSPDPPDAAPPVR